MSRLILVVAATLFALAQGIADASAQSYPQRTVKFVLPFGAASGTDMVARLLGDRLAKRWGQAVVIENRPGGDGIVSINTFTSANDDHTLCGGRSASSRCIPLTRKNCRITPIAISSRSSTRPRCRCRFRRRPR